jgi:hypothetical protein
MKKLIIITFLALTGILFHGCMKDSDEMQYLKGWQLLGNDRDSSEIGLDSGKYDSKPVFYLKCNSTREDAVGTAGNNLNPGKYIGKRVRLSGYIKTGSTINLAQMFMRVDGGTGAGFSGNTIAYDGMEDRAILSGTDWQKYEIVLDVSEKATSITYGVHVYGKGEIWFSGLTFDIVGNDVPATDIMKK